MVFTQALEAKEKVDIQNENQTLASITYKIILSFMKSCLVVLERTDRSRGIFGNL